MAGCTDYFPGLDGLPPDRIVDVAGVKELIGIRRQDNGWRIGGSTTWTELINYPLPAAFDGLKAAAREVGSIQIQNAGTVAGNICNASPAADGVPPLLTLDALVEISSESGSRCMPLSDFIVGPRKIRIKADELVSAVLVPDHSDRKVSSFLKLGSRRYLVISIVMVAVICEVDTSGRVVDMRIAIGSCSPVATRLHELEGELLHRNAAELLDCLPVDEGQLVEISPISDVRGTDAYRRVAAAELCRRAVQEALQSPIARST